MAGLCEVCGKPIRKGKIHHKCSRRGGYSLESMSGSLDRVIDKTRENLDRKLTTGSWDKSMGEEELKKRFPDLYEREQKNRGTATTRPMDK